MLDDLSHRLYGAEHAAQDQGHLGVHHGEAHGGAVLPPAHGGEVFAAPVDHTAPEGEDDHPDQVCFAGQWRGNCRKPRREA